MKNSKLQIPSSNEAANFKLQSSNFDEVSSLKHQDPVYETLHAPRILIAGIGNIFLGDDAFGCEVVKVVLERSLPDEVKVIDFGIRSYDLAYALLDDYQTVILVDAVSRGASPGTVFLIEPETGETGEQPSIDPHSMNAISVIQMARRLGGIKAALYLVGCEAEKLQSDDGALGLSPTAVAAVPHTIKMIETLVKHLLQSEQTTDGCAARA